MKYFILYHMKYLNHLSLLLLCLPVCLSAQPQVLSSSSQSLKGIIDLAKGELNNGITSPNSGTKVSNLNMAIQNGDIVITYQLPVLEEDHFFEIIPVIKLDGQQLLLATDEFRGDLGRPVPPGSKQIIWLNPLERYINLVGQLEVTLTTNEWGELELPYDCALGEPTFTNKQKMPYILAAGLGAASIGVGQLIKNQRDDIYQQYQDAENLAAATPLYEDANGKNHTYLILTYAGTAILVADAVMYLIRQGKYKKDLKNWETYCKPDGIGFQPVFELPDGGLRPNGNVGFKMTIPIGRR